MNRQDAIKHLFVEFIPKNLDEGVIYISERFRTASHLCCCGCGGRVVTPLNPAKWQLKNYGASVSLTPSIGNGAFACRSHYIISHGKVVWCAPMTDEQTALATARDEYAAQVYTGERIIEPPQPDAPPAGSTWPKWLHGLIFLYRRALALLRIGQK